MNVIIGHKEMKFLFIDIVLTKYGVFYHSSKFLYVLYKKITKINLLEHYTYLRLKTHFVEKEKEIHLT